MSKNKRVMISWIRKGTDTLGPRPSLYLFTFSVAVVVASIFYVAISVEGLLNDYAMAANSHSILDGLATTQSIMESQANALRSYIVTGDEPLYANYRAISADVNTSLISLHRLADGSPALQVQLLDLEAAVREQSAASERVVNAYRGGDRDRVKQLLTAETSKIEIPDHVRTAIASFESKERALLATSMARASRSLQYSVLAGCLGLAMYFLIQCVAFARMDKEAERRVGADVSLVKANAELAASLDQARGDSQVNRTISQFRDFLQSCLSVKEAILLAMKQVAYFLPDASVEVALFRNAHDSFELYRWNEDASVGAECSTPAFGPLDCWGLRRGQIHVFMKTSSAPRCDHIKDSVVRSMCIPISGQGDIQGLMCLQSERPVGSDVSDWSVAQKIVDHLAPVLINLTLQEALRNQLMRDQLTGLFNRRYLDESLIKEISRARRHNLPVTVMMLDIDHFKTFNDTYGHEGGDAVLAGFGNLLASSVRLEDIACRYGGEEFTLVLPGATHEFGLQRAEEIRVATHKIGLSRGSLTKSITTSIGVATFPLHGQSADSVLAAADAALYLAKNAGRNRVVGASTLNVTGRQKKTVELLESGPERSSELAKGVQA